MAQDIKLDKIINSDRIKDICNHLRDPSNNRSYQGQFDEGDITLKIEANHTNQVPSCIISLFAISEGDSIPFYKKEIVCQFTESEITKNISTASNEFSKVLKKKQQHNFIQEKIPVLGGAVLLLLILTGISAYTGNDDTAPVNMCLSSSECSSLKCEGKPSCKNHPDTPEDKPAKDASTEDKPAKDAPTKDKPAKDASTEDKPTNCKHAECNNKGKHSSSCDSQTNSDRSECKITALSKTFSMLLLRDGCANKPCYISQTPLTKEQYIIGCSPNSMVEKYLAGVFAKCITGNTDDAYLGKLSNNSDYTFRLATTAEWRWAFKEYPTQFGRPLKEIHSRTKFFKEAVTDDRGEVLAISIGNNGEPLDSSEYNFRILNNAEQYVGYRIVAVRK